MKYTDFYALLEVSVDASVQEIRRAYRQQAKRHHPDTHPGDGQAEQQFKAVKEAYEVLIDPEKRARFNAMRAELKSEPPPSSEEPADRPRQDADSLFDAHFGDFYDTFFGPETARFWDRRGQEAPRPTAEEAHTTPSLKHTLEVSLEEALKGTHQRVQIHEGALMKTIEVNIPVGVIDGTQLHVLQDEDDFYFVVRLLAHPMFTPEGHDLHRDLHIEDYEAILGTKKMLSTLSGTLQMTIPAGVPLDKVFRIRGYGLALREEPTERGDLYVHLKIDVSQALCAEEVELMERFRDLRASRQTNA